MLGVEVNGTVTVDGIDMTPRVNVVVEHADFTLRPVIEGPIISPIGLTIAIGVAVVLLTEHFVKTARR